MHDSVEVKVARMDEQLKAVREDMDLARESRKQQYEMIENVHRILIKVEHRMDGVEKTLAAATPTIDEFVNIKLKVQGAGMAGKAIWATVGAILTVAIALRETIIGWMTR